MPRFFYVAQNRNKEIERGNVESRDRASALHTLTEQGLEPIKLEQVSTDNTKKPGTINIRLPKFFKSTLTVFDQIIIVRHLGIIMNTGTDILTGLDILARDALKPMIKDMLYDIKNRVAHGEKLSDALYVHRDQFNPIFINLIKSGEVSGNLPSILLAYAQELKKDYEFVRKLRSALFYPSILMAALLGMVILILSVVAPRLKELFASLKAAPPFYIKFFFAASDIWRAHTLFVSIALIAFIVMIIVGLKNRKTRMKLVTFFRFIPFLNKIQRNLTLMRLSKTVANLIHAGFSLKSALITASEVVDIRYKQIVLDIAQKDLEHGLSLTDSMKKYQDFFPDILISAVATGEKSGKLSLVLSQMAEFYEEEIIYNLETFFTLLEPILLVIVGLVIGLMAGAMISPIYKLIGRF